MQIEELLVPEEEIDHLERSMRAIVSDWLEIDRSNLSPCEKDLEARRKNWRRIDQLIDRAGRRVANDPPVRSYFDRALRMLLDRRERLFGFARWPDRVTPFSADDLFTVDFDWRLVLQRRATKLLAAAAKDGAHDLDEAWSRSKTVEDAALLLGMLRHEADLARRAERYLAAASLEAGVAGKGNPVERYLIGILEGTHDPRAKHDADQQIASWFEQKPSLGYDERFQAEINVVCALGRNLALFELTNLMSSPDVPKHIGLLRREMQRPFERATT